MLPLLLALAAVQPAVATDNHATLLAQSDAIDANFSAVRAKQVQVSYLALADRARALGDAAVANALSAKAAYALVIQGRNDEARLALVAIAHDAASTTATRSFAMQLLAYLNRPGDKLGVGSDAVPGGYHMATHGLVGLSLAAQR
ncbi:hypothetical protein QH494_13025 [Sphingomonas sp. AR_OL41]|jgi:hypothetical protein|uniref:hypothetical protein n=1 Tax=Sphingomonas sp. AR_OL41 TaxID=3042729 RepID=UPI0024817F64|nr:hypothetical protein [Sphingomonas sp. AR_OL41]MDH7973104.1 hypothetical protein [Sphingomonas sp. AR_OL41]